MSAFEESASWIREKVVFCKNDHREEGVLQVSKPRLSDSEDWYADVELGAEDSFRIFGASALQCLMLALSHVRNTVRRLEKDGIKVELEIGDDILNCIDRWYLGSGK